MTTWLEPILNALTQPQWDYVLRLVMAILLGGLIGLERELRDKPAGFRTIILICLGACIFTMVSQRIGGPDWEATRIAAQIVSGIGFLGAGAIIQSRQGVVGLTTAATIWAVAAIGMAVGFGLLAVATAGTVAIWIALTIFDWIENWIGRRRDIQDYYVTAKKGDQTFERILALFRAFKLQPRKRIIHEEGDMMVVHVVAMGSKSNHERLRLRLVSDDAYTLRPAYRSS